MEFVDVVELRSVETWLKADNGARVCKCKMTYGNGQWSVSEWFTTSDYQHKGYGLKTMAHTVAKLLEVTGVPNEIRYIWNGDNEYVFEWLTRHFAPVSLEPIAVQKYATDDDWASHIYILDKNRFLKFFSEVNSDI